MGVFFFLNVPCYTRFIITQWFGTVFYEEKNNKSFWRVLQAFAVASSLLYYRVVYQQIIYVVRSTVGFYGFIDHVHHHHFLSGQ